MDRARLGSPARRDLGEVDGNAKREGVRACVCVCEKTLTAVVVSKFCNVYAASIPHHFSFYIFQSFTTTTRGKGGTLSLDSKVRIDENSSQRWAYLWRNERGGGRPPTKRTTYLFSHSFV